MHKQKTGLLARFFLSLFAAMVTFGLVLFAGTCLSIYGINGIPIGTRQGWLLAAGMAAVFVFVWKFVASGFVHLVMSITCILVAINSFVHMPRLPELFSGSLGTLSLTREPVYENETLLASEPINIWYIDDGDEVMGVSQELVDELVDFTAILPQELLEKARGLYLVEDGAFLSEEQMENGMEIFGFSSSGSMTSSIRLIVDPSWNQYAVLKSGQMALLDDSQFYKETIIHELSHLMDMIENSSKTIYSQDEEFQRIYQADPNSISEYGATDAGEFFAEAAIYYYLYPELLAQKNMDLFYYFDRQFDHYSEEY